MIEFKLTQAPFRMGLAEGDDPHQVPFGSLVEAKNVRWTTAGRMEKRFGTSAALTRNVFLGSGGVLSSIKKLGTRGGELFAIGGDSLTSADGEYLYSYSDGNGWKQIHKVPDVDAHMDSLIAPDNGVAYADMALSGTKLLVAWLTNDPYGSGTTYLGYVSYVIYDIRTLAVLKAPASIALSLPMPGNAYKGIRTLVVNGEFIILWRNANGIYATNVNVSSLTQGTTTLLRNDAEAATGGTGWDALTVGNNFVLAYENTANALKLYSYNNAHVQQATGGITGEAGTGFTSIALDQSGTEDLLVAYHVTSSSRIRVATANYLTLAQVLAPVTQWSSASYGWRVFITRLSSTGSLVGWSSATTAQTHTQQILNATLAVVANTPRLSYHTYLLGPAFALDGRYYAPVDTTPLGLDQTPSVFSSHLVEIRYDPNTNLTPPHQPVHGMDLAAGFWGPGAQTRTVTYDGRVYTLLPTLNAVPSDGFMGGFYQALQLASFGVPDTESGMWSTTYYDDNSFIHGGTPFVYDGRNCFDYGFANEPPKVTAVASNTASGAMVAGSYIYTTHFEFHAATGLKFRSPTSKPVSITFAAPNDTVTLTLYPPAGPTGKINEGDYQTIPRHIVFRSTVDGSQPYRLTYEPRYNTARAATTTATNTLVDISADASIGGSGVTLASRATPYTTGDVLDDQQPPSLVHAVIHRSRFWGLDLTRRTIWFSKSFQDDLGYAPGFSTSFRVLLDEDGVALGSLDDKLVVFGDRKILGYVLGAGPAPDGTNSDLTDVIPIQSDVGCSNPRSLIGLPMGLAFLSDRGIMLLSRGLEVSWIGRPVKDTLASYPIITSAVLVPDLNEVRWSCSNADQSESIVIVWNYVENQWSTFEYTLNSIERPAIADACLHNGAYTFALTTGHVYTEDRETHKDAGTTWVPLDFTTAWVSSAGPLGFTSVRSFMLDGTPHTHHKLNVEVGFDNESAFYRGPRTWRAGESGVTEPDDEKLHAVVSIGTRRKCHSIRFRVYDEVPDNTTTHPVTTGKGPSFQMMGIESGLKVGVTKVTSNQSR